MFLFKEQNNGQNRQQVLKKKKKTSEEKENKKITQYCPSEYKQQYLKTHTPRIDNCPPRYLSYR